MREVTAIREAFNAARRKLYALSPREREQSAIKGRIRRARLKAEGLCIRCEVKDRDRDKQHCRDCLRKAAAAAVRRKMAAQHKGISPAAPGDDNEGKGNG